MTVSIDACTCFAWKAGLSRSPDYVVTFKLDLIANSCRPAGPAVTDRPR
jgi:hypothetical protein